MLLPELLAPARNLTSGISAIQAGADAVYIGPAAFGARKAVGNSLEDIEKLCQYAHIFHAKVYVTVNTVLHENELEKARNLIHNLYNIGVDAIIFQDYSLLKMDIPPIALFASTQTHNYTIDRIKILEKAGVSRIILAREMDLKQIAEIHKQTKAELEFFIHGALCLSYSGRCYFSKAITGRSGNRGECAQPCRSYFNLYDENEKLLAKDKHVLSLKDLNLSQHLWELYEAGISSFKIEGRLKDEHYVTNIVAWYRRLIDRTFEKKEIYNKPSTGNINIRFEPDPEKVFSRGFTNYFINERKKENISPNTPKSTGKILGKVIAITENTLRLDSKNSPNPGDGICFFDKKGKLCGSQVEKISGVHIIVTSSNNINIGSTIYRNYDHLFAKQLEAPDACTRTIPLSLVLSQIENKLLLSAFDNEKNSVTIETKFAAEPAIKPDNYQTMKKQLSKSGNTPFEITNVTINTEIEYFFRTSFINELRRNCLEKMTEARINSHTRFLRQTSYFETIQGFTPQKDDNITNSLAESVYKILSADPIPEQLEKKNNLVGEIIVNTRFCLRFENGLCPGKNAKPMILKDNAHTYQAEFDCKKCEMSLRLLK